MGMGGERVWTILQVTSQSQSRLGGIRPEEQHKVEEIYFSEKDAKWKTPGQGSSTYSRFPAVQTRSIPMKTFLSQIA